MLGLLLRSPQRRATSSGSVSLNSPVVPSHVMHDALPESDSSSSRNCHSWICPLPASNISSNCVQLLASAVNVALPAFAAARRAAAPCCCCVDRAAIDRYLLPAGPTAANPPHAPHTTIRPVPTSKRSKLVRSVCVGLTDGDLQNRA